MKRKVLGYRNRGNGNAVVSRYRELEKIADGLYAFIYDKCRLNEEDDLLCLVFNVGDVYFEDHVIARKNTKRIGFGEFGAEWVRNYKKHIADDMLNGRFVSLMTLKVFEMLGWDTQPLIQYQHRYRVREEEDRALEAYYNSLYA